MTRGGLQHEFYKWVRVAGTGHLSPHDLRLTFARMGVPQKIAMLAGRWTSDAVFGWHTQNLKLDDFESYYPMRGAGEIEVGWEGI